LTIPVSEASGERSFSKLKTYLRTSMLQERLVGQDTINWTWYCSRHWTDGTNLFLLLPKWKQGNKALE